VRDAAFDVTTTKGSNMFRHHRFVAPALLSVASLSLIAAAPAPAPTSPPPPPATQPAPYQAPPARYPAPPQARKASDTTPAMALSRKLPELKFTQIPLGDAIDHVREATGANIHVNWRALEMLNVTREMPTSLNLRDVTARRALKALLDETGVGDYLTYYVDEGVIEVTTREIADNKLITRVYPVEDLVVEVPNFAGPTFNLQSQSNTASGAGGGGGSSSGLFQGSGSGDNTAGQELTTKQQRADGLVKLITETVRPEVWRDNGGTASVRYYNGHLIVTAPRSVHEQLGGKI
jgi:hypothetical protein